MNFIFQDNTILYTTFGKHFFFDIRGALTVFEIWDLSFMYRPSDDLCRRIIESRVKLENSTDLRLKNAF